MPESDEVETRAESTRSDRQRWDRLEAAEKLRLYERTAGESGERDRAAAVGVPRSTLRKWVGVPEDEESQFFASPAGLRMVQSITLAGVLVFEMAGPNGVRKMAQFLELSGLGKWVAHSRGWLHKLTQTTMEQMVAFEAEVLANLNRGLKTTLRITLCLDETFHPQVLLVAMEPVSGFILVEKYATRRDADTWVAALHESLAGLEVTVVQATSDEGQAILCVVREELEAHHSPDVFHVQHELGKGTTATLSARQRAAQRGLHDATAEVQARVNEHQASKEEPRGPGRPPDYASRVEAAQRGQQEAQSRLEQATAQREQMREAIRGVSTAYHPFDLKTGAIRSAAKVKNELDSVFDHARTIVTEAALPERCAKAVEKAGRVVAAMVSTLEFFHGVVAEHVATLPASIELQLVVSTVLLPALYLQRVASQARLAERRDALNQVARGLWAQLEAMPLWRELDEATRQSLVKSATWCANLFQRSSSNVEGRNGQLSFVHHGMHRISNTKLHCLTIIHNYFLRRADGTTAAARFFGAPHDDLFKWVLHRIPMPPRPVPQNARSECNQRRKLQKQPTAPPPEDRVIAPAE